MEMHSPGWAVINDQLISHMQAESLSHSGVTPDSYTEWYFQWRGKQLMHTVLKNTNPKNSVVAAAGYVIYPVVVKGNDVGPVLALLLLYM